MSFLSVQIEQVLDLISEPVFILDASQVCVFANKSFCTLLGLKLTSTNKLSASDFWPKLKPSDLKQAHLSVEFSLASGEMYKARLACHSIAQGLTLVRVLAGALLGAAQTNFHAQRLETLGVLAAGIAHDFNNVLAGILGHVTYLKTVLPANGQHQESIKAIEEGARKSSQMTQQILNFSRGDSLEKVKQIDLADLTSRTVKLLRGAIAKTLNIECIVPSKPVWVLADESRLAQVLVNLVVNARDALKSGGEIQVGLSVERETDRLAQVFEGVDLCSSCYALLSVRDNGHGMSREVLERAFEPYFSTKSDKGSGLGLYTVDSIVTFYGGTIDIISAPEKGTTISVYLPALESVEEERAKARIVTKLEAGQGRILVVDDEYPVRNVLSISLRHLGYSVETAGSGQEALDKYKQVPGGFDLVILDMLMPNLSGAEVFDCLVEISPQARVLIMSGFASKELIQQVLDRGGLGFMQKPFTIEDLSLKVKECLERSPK